MVEVRLLGSNDGHVFENVAMGVFDDSIEERLTAEYLSNEHNHIAVGIDDGCIVGFASGIDYIHPDKPRQLWINEVGVAASYQRRGIGRAVVASLLERARIIGCTEAWVLTEENNGAARALYRDAGGREAINVIVTFPLKNDESHGC